MTPMGLCVLMRSSLAVQCLWPLQVIGVIVGHDSQLMRVTVMEYSESGHGGQLLWVTVHDGYNLDEERS